jgi:hypothetical protein
VPKVDKILSLIRKSKYAIHDLSRIQAKRKGEFFRLNMPFELGADVGASRFGNSPLKSKRCLILSSHPYKYQAALSDLSNSVVLVHKDKPRTLATHVRNWLHEQTGKSICGPERLWGAFTDCMAAVQVKLLNDGHSSNDIQQLPIVEFIRHTKSWVVKWR